MWLSLQYCSGCGTELPVGAKFCANCGASSTASLPPAPPLQAKPSHAKRNLAVIVILVIIVVVVASSSPIILGFSIITLPIVGIVGLIVFVQRRRKRGRSVAETLTPKPQSPAQRMIPPTQPYSPSQPASHLPPLTSELSTGYGDLDRLLAGGLPEGYTVLLVSPPCDERDLLLRKIIDSALASGRPTFYVSSDPGRIQDLVGRYWKDFYALSPQADKIMSPPANLYKISGIENLSDLNISLTKMMEIRLRDPRASRLIVLDVLTDILLHHKALTTRKWLSDFLARRKAEGFITLAFLNPLIAPKEETQTVVDVFDGVIEIYEKALAERSRRFLVIKKMYGRRYSDSELMLDKEKLF